MSISRVVTGLGVVVAAASSLALAAGGCVSSNAAPPGGGEDAALPPILDDGGAPPSPDAGGPDATLPPSPADSGADTSVPAPVDAGADVIDGALPPPQASVRFAWFVGGSSSGPPKRPFGAGPGLAGVDLCVAPHGTQQWEGPLLAGAGLATGLLPYSVSKYFAVPAGVNDVLLVPAGTTTCAPLPDAGTADLDGGDGGSPSSNLLSGLPALPQGGTFTLGVVPSSTSLSGLGVVALADETSAPTGKVNLRFANVAPDITASASFGLGGGVAFDPLFASSGPTQVLDPTADALGYRALAPVATIDASLVLSGALLPGGNALSSAALPLAAGTVVSAFEAESPLDGYSPILVTCFDGQTSSLNPALSQCVATSTLSQSALSNTRFGNFLADIGAPSLDVCVRYQGLSNFVGPLVGGGADAGADGGSGLGLSPPGQPPSTPSALSGYFNLHSGFSYDLHFVAAGSASCAAAAAIPDYVYAAPSGLAGASANATLVATGFLTVPNDAGEPSMFDAGVIDAGPDASQESPGLASAALSFAMFLDENSGVVEAVRIIHLAASDPQPFNIQVPGAVVVVPTTLWWLADVPYGGFGSLNPAVDSSGYQIVGTGGTQLNVSDTIGGNFENTVLYTMPATQTDTFFVYSYTTAQFTGVQVIQCADSALTQGGIWPCTLLNGG